MRKIIIGILAIIPAFAQSQGVRWSATTGDVVLAGAATTATVQQPATGGNQVYIDQIVVYCSVDCSITQAVNGTAASATAGTVRAIMPTPLNTAFVHTFWTASNVGSGTAQGGIIHLPGGSTVAICLSPSCGAGGQVIMGTGGGTAVNYSLAIASLTGTVNVTFFGRI